MQKPKSKNSVRLFILVFCILQQYAKAQPGWLQNNGFELSSAGIYTTSNAVSGWTVMSQFNMTCTPSSTWAPGSPEFSVITTPVLNDAVVGTLTNSPLGGTKIVRLNNTTPNVLTTKISQRVNVTSANNCLFFAFAGSWSDGNLHPCCEKAKPFVQVKDCAGNVLISQPINLLLPCPGGNPPVYNTYNFNPIGDIYWCNWQVNWINLYPYIGSCVTVEFLTCDCIGQGHFGSMYLDVMEYDPLFNYNAVLCPPYINANFSASSLGTQQTVPYCAGNTSVGINAGALLNNNQTFYWTAPIGYTLSSAQTTAMPLVINNPVSGSVFTLTVLGGLVNNSQLTYTITSSNLNALAIASSSACSVNALGSASIVPNIAGLNYSYVWTNTANVIVGTQSLVSNLSPGIYNVTFSANGYTNCGIGTASVQVGIKPPSESSVSAAFCKNQSAFLSAPSGSSFQWYNANSLISSGSGGTANTYTVPNAQHNAIYHLGFTLANGCRDSIKYILTSSPPGGISFLKLNFLCQDSANGKLQLYYGPSPNYLYTNNLSNTLSLQVNSTNTASPYSFSSTNYNFYNSILSGLPASTFSVHIFDGFCYYDTLYTNHSYEMSFSLTPSSSTLCSNSAIQFSAAISTSSNVSTTCMWTPNTNFLPSSNTTSLLYTPSISIGSSLSIIYTVQVNLNFHNCPETKTIEVLVVNPITPSVSLIPELCIGGPIYSLTANPAGGIFNPGNSYAISPLSPTGILTPSNAIFGYNTYTYSYQVASCISSVVSSYTVTGPEIQTVDIEPICAGESIILMAYGASNYSWSSGAITSTLLVAPITNTYYVVTTVDSLACKNSKKLEVTVNACVSLADYSDNNEWQVNIYPSYFKTSFFIASNCDLEFTLTDNLGRIVLNSKSLSGITEFNLNQYPSGIYFVKLNSAKKTKRFKIVKE